MDGLRNWWMVFLATLVGPLSWGAVEKDGTPVPGACNLAMEVCELAEEVYGSLEPGG